MKVLASAFLSLLLLSLPRSSLADLRVVCPTDPSLFAYNSIAAINEDILSQLDVIRQNQGQVEPAYTYNLCPNTVFDGTSRLTPMLNASSFVCGSQGDSRDNCTIHGGQVQVYLTEIPSVAFSSIQYTAFHGLTFDSSTSFAVAAFGSNKSTAEFFDCHWKNNSGAESATDGGSSIHVVYEEYVAPTGITREINYNEASPTNIFDRPTRRRHLQQVPQTGMNVHVFHSTMTHGFKTNNATYRAVFSQGFVLFDNVTVAHNTGGLLTNVVGGTAIIQNSLFASNDMTAAIRVTEGGWIMVSNTNFVQNVGVANVVVVASEAAIESCGFLDNVLENAEVFSASDFSSQSSNGSLLEFTKSCIVGSTVSTPVFSDEYSIVSAERNYGESLNVLDNCGGTSPGMLSENSGSMCFQGEPCEGTCKPFDSTVCALSGLTRVPSMTPTLPPSGLPTDASLRIATATPTFTVGPTTVADVIPSSMPQPAIQMSASGPTSSGHSTTVSTSLVLLGCSTVVMMAWLCL